MKLLVSLLAVASIFMLVSVCTLGVQIQEEKDTISILQQHVSQDEDALTNEILLENKRYHLTTKAIVLLSKPYLDSEKLTLPKQE
ncbi:MAG TPA: hypothetical protein VEP90_06280 [Methylomirabilota bacterium]|nr:hypothetical protein [Methylomirabilota bacterium]